MSCLPEPLFGLLNIHHGISGNLYFPRTVSLVLWTFYLDHSVLCTYTFSRQYSQIFCIFLPQYSPLTPGILSRLYYLYFYIVFPPLNILQCHPVLFQACTLILMHLYDLFYYIPPLLGSSCWVIQSCCHHTGGWRGQQLH